MQKLVILGGGHAHVEVLRQFAVARPGASEIVLVSTGRYTPYSGMLPGLIAGHYGFDDCHIDLLPLAQRAGARFADARALKLDAARRVLHLEDGSALAYDTLSINVGSTPVTTGVAGVDEYAIQIKPVEGFLKAWAELQQRAAKGAVRRIAVVGGGAAGVEVLLAMHHRLTHGMPRADVDFVLVTDTPHILPRHPRGVRAVLARVLGRKSIAIRHRVAVTAVTREGLYAGQELIAADAVVWVTGAAPTAWLAGSGLALNDAGFVRVNADLRSTSNPEVFAVGDCATVSGAQYPKSGVYAVRQGPVLAQNLRATVQGKQWASYTPQARALALISTGEQHAVASYGPLSFHGNWVWRWKDSIDRAFMAKYRT